MVSGRCGDMTKMAGPSARALATVLVAGKGLGATERLVTGGGVRMGRTRAFASAGQFIALHFYLPNVVRCVQVGEFWKFFDMDASAIMELFPDGALNGAPNFNGCAIMQRRVEAESGAAPYARGWRKPKWNASADVGVRVEKLFV